MKKIEKKNKHLAAEIGAGAVAAAALAVAGGYVLWERMGKQKQAKVKAWVAKARKEAATNFARAKKMTEGEYKHIVDAAVERYGSLANVNKAELQKTAASLKAEWNRIHAEAKKMAQEMEKEKSTAKKMTKRKVVKRKAKK